MNRVILMGRLTRDPDIRYSTGDNSMAIARYTLAVDRRVNRSRVADGEPTADFISCVAFGKSAEFAERYLHQGTKMLVTGRIQTGSYTNRDGQKVYTTEVIIDDQEFAESKAASEGNASSYRNAEGGSYRSNDNGGYRGGNTGAYTQNAPAYQASAPAPRPAAPSPSAAQASIGEGFMNIPDGIDEELPFN